MTLTGSSAAARRSWSIMQEQKAAPGTRDGFFIPDTAQGITTCIRPSSDRSSRTSIT